MKRSVCRLLLVAVLTAGPCIAETNCSKITVGQQMFRPDCAVLSAFEASLGQHGLTMASIVLRYRSAEVNAGKPTNQYEYDVFLSDDQTARQLAEDGEAFLELRNDFTSALKKQVCQNADAIRDGAVLAFDVRFRLNDDDEPLAFGPRYASIFITSCEAL